ncbi:hypothetical protein ILYODFUR_009589 [Ilyodon furcidens]|uniref:Uncharacterized protein n=1 Tax=Ilyodon furcidens TaxID=33524 RepID=A0ABV0T8Y6_9TELE
MADCRLSRSVHVSLNKPEWITSRSLNASCTHQQDPGQVYEEGSAPATLTLEEVMAPLKWEASARQKNQIKNQ